MPALNIAPLSNLLAAVHDAYLQQREAGAAKRLRACRARMPDQPRPRAARRPIEAPQVAPQPVAPAPIAVPPAPTFEPGMPSVRPAYPGIAKTGYSALIIMLEAIDAAAADASQDGARMVEFKIGRASFKVHQTFKNLAKFKKDVIRSRTAFSDKAIA